MQNYWRFGSGAPQFLDWWRRDISPNSGVMTSSYQPLYSTITCRSVSWTYIFVFFYFFFIFLFFFYYLLFCRHIILVSLFVQCNEACNCVCMRCCDAGWLFRRLEGQFSYHLTQDGRRRTCPPRLFSDKMWTKWKCRIYAVECYIYMKWFNAIQDDSMWQ